MEFSKETEGGTFRIQTYRQDGVLVNSQLYPCPFLIMPNQIITMTFAPSLDLLTANEMETLLPFKPQVVLLGTGEKLQFVKPHILAPFLNQQIGVEVMDSFAACRTFTLLAAEGRAVLGILF